MKRVFSLLLVLLLMVGLMPVQTMADEFDDYFGNGDDNVLYVMLAVMTEDYLPVGEGYYTIMQSAGTNVDLKNYVPAGYTIVRVQVDGDTSQFTVDGDWCFTMPNAPGELLAFVAPDNGGSTPQPPQQPDPQPPQQPILYNVIVNDAENGTVTATPTQAQAGTFIAVTTEAAEGFALETLSVKDGNGDDVIVTGGQFTMPQSDVTVSATFTAVDTTEYTVTLHEGTDLNMGTATFSSSTAKKGETVTITPSPKEGYYVVAMVCYTDNENAAPFDPTKNSDGTHSFTMPGANVKVLVVFAEEIAYKVNVEQPANGTVTTDKTASLMGRPVVVTAAPAAGYKLTGISVTNDTTGETITMQADGKTFFMPNSDVTVTAAFEEDKTVTVEHITEPEQNNSYGAKLDMTDEDVLKKLLGDEAATEDTQVWMTVAKLADAPSTEKQAIEDKAASDKLATYLDIKLFKKVGNRDAETISNTNGPVTITMTLDAGVVPANAESVYIVYYHGGAKTIPASYNHSTRVLTFQAREFSTYALAYKVRAAATASVGTLDNVPKTGDGAPLMGYSLLVLCSAAMLAAVAFFDWKRVR